MERLTEIIPVFVDIIPDRVDMEHGKLYINHRGATAIHLCACGCGNEVVCDLKPEFKDGWGITDKGGLVTLRPSIGNWNGQKPYHAHYYITDNKIEWL